MIGEKILRYRAPIGIVLLAISAYMAYAASHITIATRFVDFFPRNHRNVLRPPAGKRSGPSTILIAPEGLPQWRMLPPGHRLD